MLPLRSAQPRCKVSCSLLRRAHGCPAARGGGKRKRRPQHTGWSIFRRLSQAAFVLSLKDSLRVSLWNGVRLTNHRVVREMLRLGVSWTGVPTLRHGSEVKTYLSCLEEF